MPLENREEEKKGVVEDEVEVEDDSDNSDDIYETLQERMEA